MILIWLENDSKMTLTQLQLFIALAESAAFSAAGARFGITQSSVSHTIRSLEKSVGIELFDRRTTPPALTESGRKMLPHARAMLAHAEAMQQQAQAERGLKSGLLRMGSFGPSSSLRLLPQLMHAFAKTHPGIEVRVVEEADGVIDQWLHEHRIDLGFVTLPDDRFETVLIARDEYVVVLPQAHPLAKRSAIRAKDLDALPFIASAAGCGDDIAALLAQAGAKPRELFRLPQIISVLGLVQQNLGVSISVSLALPEKWPGVVYRPFKPCAPRKIGLAMLDRTKLSRAAQAFVRTAEVWAANRKIAAP
jgi:DNA-binding transcriptional LysR family regulator